MLNLFNASRYYPSIYEGYYDDFNFYEGREEWLKSIEHIPEKAVNLFCIHWLHLEIYNGGFWQYFHNSTSVTLPEAIRGFQAIGMSEVSSLIKEASLKLGDPFPFDTEERRQIVGTPEERMDFDSLEESFYELADTYQFFRKKPKFVEYADKYAKKKND